MRYDRGSPLLAMPPLGEQQPQGRAPITMINNAGPGTQAQPSSHQIPFPTSNANNVQGLTYGFGSQPAMAAAAGSHHGWGAPSAPLRSASMAATPRRAEGKRRRGSSMDSDSDRDACDVRERSSSPASVSASATKQASLSNISLRSSPRQTQQPPAFPKRMRTGIAMMNIESRGATPGPSSATERATPTATSGDVGKMLSSLDRPALLQVLSRLLATSSDPALPDQIMSLIPPPSITTVETALDETERVIRAICAQSRDMRPEFAWGRLRAPIAEYISSVAALLPFFNDDNTHASTTFAFLHLVTAKTIDILGLLPDQGQMARLTAAHPNALASELLPTLLTQWKAFVDRVARAVEGGGMFGSEAVRNWLSSLAAIARRIDEPRHGPIGDDECAARGAVDDVRRQLESRIGWLAGGHSYQYSQIALTSKRERSASLRMDEEEEL